MWRVRELLGRFLNAVWRSRGERQLTREMQAHLDLLQEDFLRRGMPPDEARRAARRAFGGVEQAKEIQRDARSILWLDDARRDVGYALRSLRRTPGFTLVAIITLGLGIGAATVIYSVLHNVLFEPFPYSHGSRMINVVLYDSTGRVLRGPLAGDEFLDYLEQTNVFEDAAGALGQVYHIVSDAGADRASVILVTPNTLSFLGVPPLHGRHFGPADAAPDAPRVAVMSYRFWMTRFGGDPAMVGRSVTLNGEPRTIVGIMPPRFEWHVGDFWIPSPIGRGLASPPRWFQARLRRGVSLEEATAQVNVVARRRAAAFPQDYPPNSNLRVIKIIDWVVRDFRQTLYTLFAAVALLLVIACCNVANMLLARATARERELTVRAALGASRGRIVRQLLIESITLAVGGTAVGVALAYGGVRTLASVMPRAGVAWEVQLRIEESALLFALAAAVFSTLMFGLIPAFTAARRDLVASITGGSRSATAGPRQRGLRSALVVAEVALSVILLLGAGVLMRTFVSLVAVDFGFDTRNLLTMSITPPPGQQPSAPAMRQFYLAALDRVRAMPGVQTAALANGVPPVSGARVSFEIPGVDLPRDAVTALHACSEDYAATLGLQLRRGRLLSTADVVSDRKVAVVNETMAKRYFSGTDPIGRTIRMPWMRTLPVPVADPTFEIVGIVADVVNFNITDPMAPHVYVPVTVLGFPGVRLVARTSGDPMAMVEPIRRELHRLNRDVAVGQPSTLEADLLRSFYARPRFNLIVLGIFAVTGVILVALGIYGVMAYTVAQQTREIAIRLALGSERRQVSMMVLRNGLVLLAGGVCAGIGAGLLTNRLLATVLWRVEPHDPATIAGTIVLVVVVGLAACYVPAWRAMRVDPAVALRQE
jgi:putative ABC transport system permease protein